MSGRASPARVIAASILLTLATVSGRCEQVYDLEVDQVGAAEPERNDFDLPDSDGLKRDTWYFVGYQWVTIGILYVAPESVSSWSDEQKEGDYLTRWKENVTNPQFDSDDLYLNYLLHPYWGATYFVRAKERGYSDSGAFWYSMLLSSIYEFGAEALFEEVSIQDVIFTPMFGSMLGQYFMGVRRDIRQREFERGYRTTREKWVMGLTDPLGTVNQQMDRLLGRETRLQLMPYAYTLRPESSRPESSRPESLRPGLGARADRRRRDDDIVYGLQFKLQW